MTRAKPKKPRPKARSAPTKPKPAGAPDPDTQPDTSSPLSNARHERFVFNIAMHRMSQAAAYTLAGFTGDEKAARACASRLLSQATVRARLVFLQAQADALAMDVAKITREDVLLMTLEQHQRNMGVRPVRISHVIKTGKDKGKVVTMERFVYNEHAANQTLKLLHDEYGLGLGASGSRGVGLDDIAARAGLKDPTVAADIERLSVARRLAIAGGTDIELVATPPKEKKTA